MQTWKSFVVFSQQALGPHLHRPRRKHRKNRMVYSLLIHIFCFYALNEKLLDMVCDTDCLNRIVCSLLIHIFCFYALNEKLLDTVCDTDCLNRMVCSLLIHIFCFYALSDRLLGTVHHTDCLIFKKLSRSLLRLYSWQMMLLLVMCHEHRCNGWCS